MKLFAQADLLTFQNKFDASIVMMDSIMSKHKEHGLGDDILFVKSEIALKKREYTNAISFLEQISLKYKDGILVDNAIFKMAETYELRLGETKKAMELYEKILFDHPSSLYVNEARKRYRKLRGDGA